jgi:hypothetical protein
MAWRRSALAAGGGPGVESIALDGKEILMSAVIPPVTSWTWPPEVLDFARRQQVAAYLDPLLDAIRRLFPTAQSVRVFVEGDPDIRDDYHIVFEVAVPHHDIPDYVQARRRWTEELFRICPRPLVCTFRFILIPVD